jgi:GGDEF domain-containing protein
LPNTDLREGSRIRADAARADRRRHTARGPLALAGLSRRVSVWDRRRRSARELISATDATLYHVKKNGRNGVWPAVDRPVLNVVGPGASETKRRSA